MPEGDVVWRTAQRLHAALAGRELTRWDLRWPSLATCDLRGHLVLEVVSAGKHLLVRIGPPAATRSAVTTSEASGAWTLHSHLRMEGSWRIQRSESPLPRSHRVRAVVGNHRWTAVGISLGMLDLVATANEHHLIGHLGPDLLGEDWCPQLALANMLADPQRAIGEALLDQRVLAGVGTFYMCEALFLHGVSPWRAVGDSSPEAVIDLVHRLLLANRDRAVQSTTGDMRSGRTAYVHARSGLPCRRCGTTIRVAAIAKAPADRVAFFCPHCQSGPTPTDDPSTRARPLGSSPRARSGRITPR